MPTITAQLNKILDKLPKKDRYYVAHSPEILDAREVYYQTYRDTFRAPMTQWAKAHTKATRYLHAAWLKKLRELGY